MLRRTNGLIAVAVMLGLLVLIVWLRGPWVPSAFAPRFMAPRRPRVYK
jgi:hypothetical protein